MKTKNKVPYKCPICDGVGQVPGGFYNRVGRNDWIATVVSETCRQCNGTGVIFGESIIITEDNPS